MDIGRFKGVVFEDDRDCLDSTYFSFASSDDVELTKRIQSHIDVMLKKYALAADTECERYVIINKKSVEAGVTIYSEAISFDDDCWHAPAQLTKDERKQIFEHHTCFVNALLREWFGFTA